MFQTKQIKTAINSITFTRHEADIYSKTDLKQIWKQIFYAKHSDSSS